MTSIQKIVADALDQVLWTRGANDDKKRILSELIADRIGALIPPELVEIGKNIIAQDNRITDQPFFAVECQRFDVVPEDYEETYERRETESGDYCLADDRTVNRLEVLRDKGRDTGKWERFSLRERWEFVTGCFTENGCQRHINMNGHNLGKTRIYAYGSYRNPEYQAVRNFLIGLAKADE